MTSQKVGNQIRLALYVSPEQYDKLQRLSEATRILQSELLREAVDLLLAAHAKELKAKSR